MATRVMMIAGEASGDLHGSGVVRELRRQRKGIEIFGVGGDRMRQAGMDLVYHVNELGFMGFVEVVKHLPLIRSVERTLAQLLKFKRPDVVVLIDYPGFNLRFAKTAKKFGIPVVYYISPQVWAWHRSRVKSMRGVVDLMLTVFEFETAFYRKEGIEAECVGHPLLESLEHSLPKKQFQQRYGIDSGKPILALLPGSRKQEIQNIFPVMLSAGRELAAGRGMELAVGVAPTLEERYFRTMFTLDGVRLVKGATYDLMKHADFAIVTSGSATLETALFGTPIVVLYKTSWLTYLLGRMLIRVKNIGLVNIVAGKTVVPEFIQHRATPGRIVSTVTDLLDTPGAVAAIKKELAGVRSLLGTK
ncbi:MAG: lipid-A-disaccharide synthase, partial [Bacteroidota bacterium]